MADKSKTIKNASDKELDELIVRLRKENELQDLIAYIRRKSSPPGHISFDTPQVSTEEPIETLYHFGVKGMRWGVRKRRSKSSGSKKKQSTEKKEKEDTRREDYKKKLKTRKKKVSEMSDAELRDFINRTQLEKQYKDITRSKVDNGKKVAKEILAKTGKDLASKYTAKLADDLIKKAMKP